MRTGNIIMLLGILFMTLSTPSIAAIVNKTIEYKDGDVTLKSYLVYDDKIKETAPAVLVFPEWWGLNDYVKGRADQLAGLGYVAFAADMYGGGQSTTEPAKAKELSSQLYGKPLMAERAQAGLEHGRKAGFHVMRPPGPSPAVTRAPEPSSPGHPSPV